MAMAVIGVVAGVAGVGMMIPGLIPQKPKDLSHTTVVRIGAGIHGLQKEISDENMGGTYPDIMLYDGAGRYIGRNDKDVSHPTINPGGFKDIEVGHHKDMDGLGTEYLAVAANDNDAVCINYISMTWPNGASFGFLGDVGQRCGANWYYSETIVTDSDSTGGDAHVLLNRTSNCMWIDKDHSNGIKHQGFGFHTLDFSSSKSAEVDGRAAEYAANNDAMCSSAPRFKMYEKLGVSDYIPIFWPRLQYNADNTDADIKLVTNNPGMIQPHRKNRRAMKQNRGIFSNTTLDKVEKWANETVIDLGNSNSTTLDKVEKVANATARFMADVLITSALEEHSADHLCGDDMSLGPDFVSLAEGLFCDMETRRTWQLCSATVTHSCFDTKTQKMAPGPLGRRSTIHGREIPEKSYEKKIT